MQKLLLFFSLFLLSKTYSQRIEISGTLTDKLGSVINAHIINKTSKQGTFSDEKGNFYIKVQLEDELEITSIEHHTKQIIIPNIILKTKELAIQLHSKEYVLEEVEVKKTNLLGSISSDTQTIKKSEDEKLMEDLGFDPYAKKLEKIDREIYTATSSAGGVPLDYFLNVVSGRMKKLKKRKKVLENEKKMQTIENDYKDYIIHHLDIDSTEVARFIYFTHFDKDFQTNFEIGSSKMFTFLKEQAKIYIEKKNEKN